MAGIQAQTPYSILLVLEKMLAGNCPIAYYLAEEYGLVGSIAFENAEIAGIIDVLHDLLLKGVSLVRKMRLERQS